MYIWTIVLQLLYLTGRGDLVCYIRNCDPNECIGWQCNKCNGNYYLNGYSCSQCKSTCTKCNSYSQCSECKPYYYGSSCQDDCRGCSHVSCDKNDGICPSHCNTGYYKETDNKCSPCRSTCTECDSYGKCTVCPIGTYLQASQTEYAYCFMCPTRCLSCSDISTCTQCTQTSYWGTHCQNSCQHCVSECDKDNGCSAGCNTGYYMTYSATSGGNICMRCPSSCSSCTNSTDCQTCVLGFWGNKCENRCQNSCHSCTTRYSCNSCKSGYWGSYCQNSCTGCSDNICSTAQGCTSGCLDKYFMQRNGSEMHCSDCLYACKTCTNKNSCSACYSGFTGSLCQHDCRSCNGQLCDMYTGKCSYNCNPNQYFDGYHVSCHNCPNECTACTSSVYCKSCSSGRWGDTCRNNCSINCKSNTCDKSNGRCSNGCNDGFFGNNCLSSCSPGCQLCISGTVCQACKTGHFNRYGTGTCDCMNDHCISFNGENCIQCSTTEWYPYASGCCPCSSNCENNSCFSNETCISCIPGKYGYQCQSNCEWCRDVCYRDGSCVSCRDGLYGSSCNKNCTSKISRCNKCYGKDDNSIKCTRCYKGWYVEDNECKICSSHCEYGNSPTCNSTTGTCRAGCKNGYFGDKCDSTCHVTNCLMCPYPNVCQECKPGFYSKTEFICTECSANCRDVIHCNKSNGFCTSGCLDGWYGDKCSLSCPSGCITCEQYNSNSCGICSTGLYGNQCERNCSRNCKPVNGEQFCNKSNGDCIFGCAPGWFSVNCGKKCSKQCYGNACERNSGTCTFGCIDSYSGPRCLQVTISVDDDSTDVTAIGGGAGAGIAIIGTVVVSVVLWRRRKLQRETSNKQLPSEPQCDNQQEEGYQNLMLNSLNTPGGLGNDNQATTSVLDSNIEFYQELNQRTLPENTYSTLAARNASNANIKSHMDIDTAGYQNTAVCTEATVTSDYQELSPDFKENTEYCSVLNE